MTKMTTKTTTMAMVLRFSSMLAAPLLLALVVGCGEPADGSDEVVRGIQVDEPCDPDDCVPISPLASPCPEGFEPDTWSECVDADGECVWEFHDECVPVSEPEPEPAPRPVPRPVSRPASS